MDDYMKTAIKFYNNNLQFFPIFSKSTQRINLALSLNQSL